MFKRFVTQRLALAITVLAVSAGSAWPQDRHFGAPPPFLAPFLSLFGPQRRDMPEITVRPQPDRPFRGDTRGDPRQNEEDDEGQAEGDAELGPRAFCVRLCDGYYFPMGPASYGGTEQAQAMTCANLCPAAPVALYSLRHGGEVADAVGPQGRRYSALPNAFKFRSALQPGCSCSGSGKGGLAAMPVTRDFTLRRGDIVVTDQGARLFAGGGRIPFQSAQFVTMDRNNALARRIQLARPPADHAEGNGGPTSSTTSRDADAGEQPVVDASRPVRVIPFKGAPGVDP
jgi:hypothetical protein